MHENIVFTRFPVEKDFYAEDFQNGIDTMISLYGIQEFRAGILTNELHGHLGVYAIIGVKMGIRALEYFNCEIDELKIMSYAGNEPPVSCLNDGLQVSTGATLGHGLISVPETLTGRMVATFYYKNQGITISVRKETESMIKQDFSSIIKEFGLLTEEYWLQVRKLAIQYWLELDRNIIFEIHYFEN